MRMRARQIARSVGALAAFAAGLDALAGLHDADARKGQAELRLELEAVEDKLG
jgi:hypothetical protein